eukprot:CAMPEP_0206271248 /NCGR_PEP_ID=MMETSP0047_2-20121206/33327_1 /ASSEMBLY_ACC=CAM_ASM_000192 /TAXON_ID=195065 /ORGANISM="Chroomonas mesostigmatica_cf, Strain CCMP1168" /LENGTH=151 /DNA_ID=CAMNT_0053699997 /DNA_START=3 /DNA_END=455 /DNA_ORIENTATION=-
MEEDLRDARERLRSQEENLRGARKLLAEIEKQADLRVLQVVYEKQKEIDRLGDVIEELSSSPTREEEFRLLREELARILNIKEEVTADRDKLRQEIKRVRTDMGAHQIGGAQAAGESELLTASGIILEMEAMALTNSELVLDIVRLKDEKK